MRKTIQLLCVLILMVLPIHISTTSEIILTPKEKTQLNNMIKREILIIHIEKEYDLFYDNLYKIKRPDFVVEFIDKLTCEAIDSKSLPSIVISQAALETGFGKYNKLKNNLFGIKGRGITTKTKEYYNGRFITIRAEFQYFPTIKDAFNRHYQILNRYGVYGYDYKTWINRIMICGYATDPNYDKKLNSIIEKYQLQRLDKIQILNFQISEIGNTQLLFFHI